MFLPVASRLLLGLFCLNGCIRPEGAAAKSYNCRQLRGLPRGTVVTTKPFVLGREGKTKLYKLWCGQQSGQFLAVEPDKLFHLTCTGANNPNKAKGAILNFTDQGAKELKFKENEVCYTHMVTLVSNANAAVLAYKLDNVEVPFNRQNCNVQHYIDYLTSGKVTAAVMERCPVHRAFDNSYLINTQSFQLTGRNGYYAWPEQDNIGALTLIASSRPKVPPQSAITPRNRTSSPPKVTYGNKPTPARSTSKTAAWIKGAARAVTRSISGSGRNGRNGKNGQIVAEKKHSFHGASTGGCYGAYHKSAAGRVEPFGGFHFPSLSTWNPTRNVGNQNWQPAGGHYLG